MRSAIFKDKTSNTFLEKESKNEIFYYDSSILKMAMIFDDSYISVDHLRNITRVGLVRAMNRRLLEVYTNKQKK